jgi:hypothetical protein
MTKQILPISEMDSTNLKKKKTINKDKKISLFCCVRIKTLIILYTKEPEDLGVRGQGFADQERLSLVSPITFDL